MKTLLFSDTVYDPNGVSRFIQDMAKMAELRGDEFVVITSTKKSFFHKRSANIINITPLFAMGMPFYKELDLVIPNYFKIKKLFLEHNPDVVNIATPGFIGLIALHLAKRYKKRIVGTYHTDFSAYMYENLKSGIVKKISLRYLRYFYKDFDRLFTRSNKYTQHMVKEVKIEPSKIVPLPAAIDINRFSSKFKESTIWRRLGVDERAKLLFVGRLTVEKNIKFLVEVYKEIEDANFIFIGEGALRSYIQKELPSATLLGLKKGKELSQIYASSDIFVFPSTTETLGQVVMEAMASGTAAIVANKGGQLDFCTEENSLILPLDKELWVESIKRLIADEQLREQIAKEGQKSVEALSMDALYEKFTQV
jgi:glycosyltransferase involved in cell wall biosynthesis